MPQKLDDCVAQVKGKKGIDNPWAVCNASLGKETKEHHNPMDIPVGHELNKTKEQSYPWGKCRADQSKAGHDKNSSDKIYDSIKAEITEAIIREKLNANRMDGHSYRPTQARNFNPPITKGKIKPQIDKTTKGIGGQVGKIDSDSNTNNMTTDMWKKIIDAQLRRNVEEPRYS